MLVYWAPSHVLYVKYICVALWHKKINKECAIGRRMVGKKKYMGIIRGTRH